MLTSLIRFVFISFLFSSAAVFSADNVSNSTEPSAPQISPQPTSNVQLPEWFYRELTSIRKDVSVLDATGASKEQIQELKERIGAVEVRLEESQLRVDGRLNEQSGRIGDIAESNTFSIALFAVIAGVLGTLIAVITIINSWKANREAVANAEKAASEKLDTWTQKKETDLTEKFDQKLAELSVRHEKEFQKIRDNAKEQAFDNDINEAYALSNKDRKDDAISRITSIIREVENSDVEMNQRIHAKALYYKGLILYVAGQSKGSNEAFRELIARFKTSSDIAVQDQVAKAMLNEGVTLGKINRSKDAITAYNELIELFKDNEVLSIQENVAKAHVNKAIRLGKMNLLEEAIVGYGDIVDRLKGSKEKSIQEQVATALSNKAELVLVTQDKQHAKKSIQDAILFIKNDYKLHRTILEILNFMIEESTIEDVLSKVENIPEGEARGWGLDEIRSVIDKLESPRKEQVEAFARFFEEHKDKAKLKEELGQIPKE